MGSCQKSANKAKLKAKIRNEAWDIPEENKLPPRRTSSVRRRPRAPKLGRIRSRRPRRPRGNGTSQVGAVGFELQRGTNYLGTLLRFEFHETPVTTVVPSRGAFYGFRETIHSMGGFSKCWTFFGIGI